MAFGRQSYSVRRPAYFPVSPSGVVPFVGESHVSIFERLVLPFFLLSSLLVVCAACFLLVSVLASSDSPEVLGLRLPSLSLSRSEGSDRDAFISKLNAKMQRQLASKVHFVAQLIQGTNRSPNAVKLARSIVYESYRAGIDPLFVAAIIKSESTFNATALSSAGAMGLMQIRPSTGRYISEKTDDLDWHGAFKLNDPHYNIRTGIAYLKYLDAMFKGNRERMLVAYNWGPGNMLEAMKGTKVVPGGSAQYARTILRDTLAWNSQYEQTWAQLQYLDVSLAG